MFVTLFYGLLDTSTGRLTYSNAGHNPPVLVKANGRTDLLRGRGVSWGSRLR